VFVSKKPLHVSVFYHDHLQGVLRCALCRYYSSRWFPFVEFVLLRSMWPHVYVICACLVFLSVGDLLHKQICVRWVCIITHYVAACVCYLCVFGVLVCWWSASQADLRSLSLYYYALCGRMCMLSVCVWCSCLLVICLGSSSPTDKNTKHAQITYTCGHILRNNTNTTNANQQEE